MRVCSKPSGLFLSILLQKSRAFQNWAEAVTVLHKALLSFLLLATRRTLAKTCGPWVQGNQEKKKKVWCTEPNSVWRSTSISSWKSYEQYVKYYCSFCREGRGLKIFCVIQKVISDSYTHQSDDKGYFLRMWLLVKTSVHRTEVGRKEDATLILEARAVPVMRCQHLVSFSLSLSFALHLHTILHNALQTIAYMFQCLHKFMYAYMQLFISLWGSCTVELITHFSSQHYQHHSPQACLPFIFSCYSPWFSFLLASPAWTPALMCWICVLLALCVFMCFGWHKQYFIIGFILLLFCFRLDLATFAMQASSSLLWTPACWDAMPPHILFVPPPWRQAL